MQKVWLGAQSVSTAAEQTGHLDRSFQRDGVFAQVFQRLGGIFHKAQKLVHLTVEVGLGDVFGADADRVDIGQAIGETSNPGEIATIGGAGLTTGAVIDADARHAGHEAGVGAVDRYGIFAVAVV